MDAEYFCAYCGASNATMVDPSGGKRQIYVEDCQTCCRPNVLRIEIGSLSEGDVYIEAEGESGASR